MRQSSTRRRKPRLQRVQKVTAALGFSAILMLTVASPSAAQTVGAGAIEGRVTDESGAVLPGVSVTASSPSLQLRQATSIASGDGSYRLVDMPAGLYHIVYELAGFQTVIRDELRVSAGVVAKVDIVLKLGSLEETLTVTGQSPVIDVTTTMASTNFTNESLAAVPTSRSIYEILGMTPGIRIDNKPDVGGSQLALQNGYRNYGIRNGTMLVVEGVSTSAGDTGSTGTFTDVLAFDEVKVNSGGQDASVQLPGVNMLMIVKSGSNDYHGSATFSGQHRTLQSNNIDDALRAVGINNGNATRYLVDPAADLGGRLIRNKLWFYASVREPHMANEVLGYAQAPGPDGKYGTGDDVQGFHHLQNEVANIKGTFQPTKNYKFVGFWYRNNKIEPDREGTRYKPFENSMKYNDLSYVQKGEFQWMPTDKILVNALVGHYWYQAYYFAQPDADRPGNPERFDQTTLMYTGPLVDRSHYGPFFRWTATANASFFPKAELFGGSQTFRFGFQSDPSKKGSDEVFLHPAGNYTLVYDTIAGVAHQPSQIITDNGPVTALNNSSEYSLYASEKWTRGRITINVGARWDRYRAWLPQQSTPGTAFGPAVTQPALDIAALHNWKPIVGRFGAIYDLRGDGKTVIKGFYGRFGHTPTFQLASQFDQLGKVTTTYRWRDLDGNGDYTPGEVNLSPTGPDFISRTGGSNAIQNDALREPFTDQVSLGFEQEVLPNTSLRTLYVYSRQSDLYSTINPLRPYSAYNIPITRKDPGGDGILNTSDDGGFVTLYDYDPAFRGSRFVATQLLNRPTDRPDIFNSFEVTVNRRSTSSQPLDILLSYAATKNHRWLVPIAQSPNDNFFPIEEVWDTEFKATASYRLPHNYSVGAVFRTPSGDPGQRTYVFRQVDPLGGLQLAQSVNITIPLEEPGAHRAPTLNLLSLKLAKRLTIGSRGSLSIDVDLFNALNINEPAGFGYSSSGAAISWVSGPTFGVTNGIVSPRVLRLGATFTF